MVVLLTFCRLESWIKLLKSFKLVILQLMAFRFLKQVGTTRRYNLPFAVNDDYILDVKKVLSVLDSSVFISFCDGFLNMVTQRHSVN